MTEPTATKKKLPFKPTALRRKPATTSNTEEETPQATHTLCDDDDDDDLALFRRSKEMAPIVEADRERRMRRQMQKQQEQEEERRRVLASNNHSLLQAEDAATVQMTTTMSTATQSLREPSTMATREEGNNRELVTPPPSKRSRLSASASSTKHRDTDVDHINDSMPESPTIRAMRSLAPDRSITPAAFSASLYASTSTSGYSTRSQARVSGAPPSGSSHIIVLDSDSETEDAGLAVTAATGAIVGSPLKSVDDALLTSDLYSNVDTAEDDDEFAEYVRKAQEQRDRLLAQDAQYQGPLSALTPGPFDEPSLPSAGIQSGFSSPAPPHQRHAQNPIIDIIVMSDIPNARHLCFKFCFDRPMRLVRDNWTAAQHRHNVNLRGPGLLERDDDVILTWRKEKVYMFSTLLSLGIRPSEAGDGTAVVDAYARDGLNEDRTRVQMQAWTPAMFEKMTRDEEMRRRRDAGELSDDEGGGHGGTQGTTGSDGVERGEQEAAKLRVILKSRDMEPVKLRVIAETTTETLVAAFRAQRPMAEGATIGLWFDGMQLEDGATMMDADIDDMDTIEVHVK